MAWFFKKKGDVILNTLKTYAVLKNLKLAPDNNITTENRYCKLKRKALDFSSDDNLDSEDEWKPNNNHKSSDSEENDNYLSENIMTKESENIVEQEL